MEWGVGAGGAGGGLEGRGVWGGDVAAACLTHLDSDHFNANWIATLVRQNIQLFCHADKAREVVRNTPAHLVDQLEALLRPFDVEAFHPLEGLCFRPIPLAHDSAGSHGFVIDGFDYRIGFATDL